MDVYGLVGNPVDHSRSPPMHEAAYEALGLDARYVTFGVDSGKFETAVEGAAALGVAGLNVTVPFKRDAVDHPAVEPAPDAARVGAANTLLLDGDSIVAHNTDVDGVIRSFERHDVDLDGADAVLVGAGGAARAAAVALVDAGATVHVANRTVERAESLAADLRALDGDSGDATAADDDTTAADASFGDRTATAAGLDSLAATVPEADVLLNATSVGMEAPEETAVDGDLFHADLAVLDAVYAPLRTRLLREAEAAGATTIDGAWMLLYQGVAALELWTEREAPVEVMNEALRATL